MKPKDWDLFLHALAKDYEIKGKLREIFLVRFAYENWRKADKEIWELAQAASQETYKKQMTETYSYFASTQPRGCPELDPNSKGPGKFQILREWFKEIKYLEWLSPPLPLPTTKTTNITTYIPRQPLEIEAYQEIHKLGAILHIKAPQKMGKSLLMQAIIAHAKESSYHTIYLNLQSAEANLFSSLDKFLRWFSANASLQLQLDPCLEDYWDEELFGSLVSCKSYWQSHILSKLINPLVVGIDNLDRIFEHPQIAQDFLPMLRYWHEETNNLEIWQKLRLVLANSTEVYLKLDAHQSPFNVGKQIKLPGFNQEQIVEFAHAYGLDQTQEIALKLQNLVGGHPYLVKIALEALSQKKVTTASLEQEAPTQAGIYGSHLLRQWESLNRQPQLVEGLKMVLGARGAGVELEPLLAYQLESMGLVVLTGNQAKISCQLYQRYFSDRL